MGVAVLPPQDCLKDVFSRNNLASPHMKYPRNPNPNRPKRPQPNRLRRSPPRRQTKSPPTPPPLPARHMTVPAASKFSNKKNGPVIGQVKILKRGEEILLTTVDLPSDVPDLGSTRRIGPDPDMVPTQIRLSGPKLSPIACYAGPVTLTSPPPSELPLPVFFTKKSVSVLKNDDATTGLRRILRLNVA